MINGTKNKVANKGLENKTLWEETYKMKHLKQVAMQRSGEKHSNNQRKSKCKEPYASHQVCKLKAL